MAIVIDGKAVAASLRETVSADVAEIVARHGRPPGLAVVLVGNDPASEVYVGNKMTQCRKVGISSFEHRLSPDIDQNDLILLIDALNQNPLIDGILVQLPLPSELDAGLILDRINPAKDVDGFHPVNVGRLSTGTGGLIPCTPLGCITLLDGLFSDYRGLNAVVIGKSNVVGKPLALLLLDRECTVTVTHIATRNLAEITRHADILVAAAGAVGLVRGNWVKPGAVVIDVGITRVVGDDGKTRLLGDCASDEMDHARAVTPVPGGVGPMTIACLLSNTVRAARSILET
ncbi:bifunctional methylenetetrahydrofolate dehydrogenase/methenyltetrahydrofolate cyclohydrolase FolD [Sphingomonas sp. UYEF23]|uniref:bifunctional methylenetetrahydrofolate dehydrogenase/methenyltetrahydrofolate cyclohydrolase FolD n=1 Tax=Sphingomonas sp. UYEF23 TaxID=1756408 RepID=UPI00339B1FBC